MTTEAAAVVAEHLPIIREALVGLLRDELGMGPVETADQPETVLSVIRATHPALAVIDHDMIGTDAIEVAEMARRLSPTTGIMLLAMHFTDTDLERAGRADVHGYASKAETINEIRRVVEQVLAGRVTFSRSVRTRLAGRRRPDPTLAPTRSPLESLTEREVQVLTHVALGLSVKEIATLLNGSPRTIDRHKTSIMAKLDIHDRVSLARYAIREGLVSAWDEGPQ